MFNLLLANLVVILHFFFIAFVILGGFAVLRWRWLSWLHLPAATWGALVELADWVCPLTPLEMFYRRAAGQAGYAESFIEHYLLRFIYPAGLTREVQLILGGVVIAINVSVYSWILIRAVRQRGKDAANRATVPG